MDGVHTMDDKKAAKTGHPSTDQVKEVLKEFQDSLAS
jgi:hypothetical protein